MNDWLRLKLAGQAPDQIRKTLDKRYANLAKSAADLNGEDAFQSFLNAYTNAIDPHTDYFNPRTAERFNQQMSLSLEGIGAVLQKQDDVVVVREIVPGGPAALSKKLQPGDRIVAVGQGSSGPMEDVVGWRIDDVVEKIKGAKGTQVRLDIIPPQAGLDSKPNLLQLTCARIRLEEQAAKSKLIDLPAAGGVPAHRIGVIELPAFYQDFEGRRDQNGDYASATRDVARLLAQFKTENVDGVVIDLRNNGGGSLDEAVNLTGLFIDKGPVVQVRESSGRVSVDGDDNAGVAWDGPLAVLVNRGSASASEIFAGAIKDYGRGLIIGENTFGKGTVQNLVDLDRWPANDGSQYGQVKLTIAQFFLPGGSSTQNKGVAPDIAFPVTVDASEFGESTYDNALPWTRIASAPHVQYGNFSAIVPRPSRGTKRARTTRNTSGGPRTSPSSAPSRTRSTSRSTRPSAAPNATATTPSASSAKPNASRLGLAADPLAADDADDGLQASERDIARTPRARRPRKTARTRCCANRPRSSATQ